MANSYIYACLHKEHDGQTLPIFAPWPTLLMCATSSGLREKGALQDGQAK